MPFDLLYDVCLIYNEHKPCWACISVGAYACVRQEIYCIIIVTFLSTCVLVQIVDLRQIAIDLHQRMKSHLVWQYGVNFHLIYSSELSSVLWYTISAYVTIVFNHTSLPRFAKTQNIMTYLRMWEQLRDQRTKALSTKQ